MARKTAMATDDDVMVCIEDHFAGADPGFYREGSRVRRSAIRPFVASLWVVDCSDDVEVARARYASSSEGSNPEYWRNEHGPQPKPQPMVRCVTPFSETISRVLDEFGKAAVTVTFNFAEGDLLPDSHPLALQFPSRWVPVPDGEGDA